MPSRRNQLNINVEYLLLCPPAFPGAVCWIPRRLLRCDGDVTIDRQRQGRYEPQDYYIIDHILAVNVFDGLLWAIVKWEGFECSVSEGYQEWTVVTPEMWRGEAMQRLFTQPEHRHTLAPLVGRWVQSNNPTW